MSLPLHLSLVLLLAGLSLHLLNLNAVRLAALHVQLMVAYAEQEDPLVDPQAGGIEHKVLVEQS